MARFLIEVPHAPEEVACWRAIHALLATGSHYITHADWGCRDGEHKAWLTVDVDGKDDARQIVPPGFRDEAKIVQLCKFSLREAEDMLRTLRGEEVQVRSPAAALGVPGGEMRRASSSNTLS